MNYIGIVILSIFAWLYLWLGLKRSFFIFFCYCFFDYGVTFYGAICYKDIILILYLLANIFKYRKCDYYFLTALFFLAGSMLLSEALSMKHHWPATFNSLIRIFAPAYILSCLIQNVKDLKFIFYVFLYSIILISIYSFVELYLGFNPVIKFIWSINGDNFNILEDNFRYGVKRVQSFFIHATSFSYFCVVTFTLLALYVRSTVRKYLSISTLYYVIVLICLFVCTMLTGTRSSILPLLFFICYWAYKNSIRNFSSFVSVFISVVCLCVIISFFAYDYINDLYISFVDNNNFSGSSTDMRSGQLSATLRYWADSPIWGHGMEYSGNKMRLDPDLYGAESIWFPILMNYGLIGCVAYAFCLLKCFLLLKVKMEKAIVFMSVIVFINTMTSVPGFDTGFILSMCIIAKSCIKVNKMELLFKYKHE